VTHPAYPPPGPTSVHTRICWYWNRLDSLIEIDLIKLRPNPKKPQNLEDSNPKLNLSKLVSIRLYSNSCGQKTKLPLMRFVQDKKFFKQLLFIRQINFRTIDSVRNDVQCFFQCIMKIWILELSQCLTLDGKLWEKEKKV